MHGELYVFKRWFQMLNGKSVFHMRQAAGKYYVPGEVKGYYSDLRHKVTGDILLDADGVPYNKTQYGETIHFAITIFQYGLGAYDLYLETQDAAYREKFFHAVDWAMKNQEKNGSWDAFGWAHFPSPYSSMAQSEGASLLCRAFKETGESKYLNGAAKACSFMLKPVQEGGTARYEQNTLFFEESSKVKSILNGMMFSMWGLYDVILLTGNEKFKKKLNMTVDTLAKSLKFYDCGYWSYYDLEKNMASPFYHDLHIEQLKVMYKLFRREEFKHYIQQWKKYQESGYCRKKSFLKKAVQKLRSIENTAVLVK